MITVSNKAKKAGSCEKQTKQKKAGWTDLDVFSEAR
jgi:hypothetical protein